MPLFSVMSREIWSQVKPLKLLLQSVQKKVDFAGDARPVATRVLILKLKEILTFF